MCRGRFSVVRNVRQRNIEGASKAKFRLVAKIIPYNERKHDESLTEYTMLRNINQDRIVHLHEVFLWDGYVILILEKLYGENVARSLSLKNKYNEHQVK
jgi:hypothetical protein